MKPECFLFLVLLGFGRLGLTVSSFDESNVKSYHVERRPNSNPDLFVFNLKSGSQCDNCVSLKAHFHGKSPCSCTCSSDNSTFLPSLRHCTSQRHLPTNFTDCPNQKYEKIFGVEPLTFPVNLHINNKKETTFSSKQYNCSLYGYYLDYSGFKVRWKYITDKVFHLTKENNAQKKFIIQGEDKDGKLSGMIIYLKLTCVRQNHESTEKCYLLKALGNVTYYAPSTSSSGFFITVPTAVSSPNPSSMFAFSPSPQLSQSMQTFSQSLSPQPTTSPSPSPSLDATTRSPTKHTDKFSTFVSKHVETSSLQTRPVLHSAGPILPSTSTAELESFLPVNSEEISDHVINTGIPKSSTSTEEPNYSEPSELPTTESSLPTRDVPGDKEARKGGKDKGVAIGAGVGGAVIFGIIVIGLIIVFCKRRRLRESTEKIEELHVGVKNPVYEKPQDDIQMERYGEKATTFSGKDSQPTYMELVDNRGHESYGAVYSTADENYDNSSVYQGLDKNTPAAPPVYQSLQNNQPSTKKPMPKQKISNAEKPEKPSVPSDPVYNVLEESHIKQGNTSEAIYNVLEGPDPGHDTSGNIQDPVYNVLDGPDAGQTYEAPDVGVQQDPLYNVLEVPESKQEHQEPLYNVLESADTEDAPSRQDGSYDGAVSEPLYNVLDGADSSGANSSGAEYAAPNRHLSAEGHDNPAYEQTLEIGAPHALVHSPGSERESLYEPLKGSDRQDVYEPLHKKGK